MKKHVELLAILQITYSAIGFVGMIVVSALLSGAGVLGLITDNTGGPLIHAIIAGISTALLGIAIAVGIPGIIAGIGLLKFRNWARILTLIIAVLNVLRIPFGTALSVYAFWVLMQEETIQLFKSKA
jgi:hypothetical protein